MVNKNGLAAVTKLLCLAVLLLIFSPDTSGAAKVSDIRNTRHNLSSSGLGTVKADSETKICVFCHTPHHSEDIPGAPLWNRKLSGATYTPYTSGSLDTIGADQPDGSSKLCLGCHDGTIAIGAVNVLNGEFTDQDPATEDIVMQGVAADKTMPVGAGVQTGFTRDIGINLTNDHPISFTYDTDLATLDGELYDPAVTPHIATRGTGGADPLVPLESDGSGNSKLQCISCHDPHMRDTSYTPPDSAKFLRLNRFQKTSAPLEGNFLPASDIICVACHNKPGWGQSAHGTDLVAIQTYIPAAATLREFPADMKVWEASCLNCHDTHTVQGARRLLREGTDSLDTPKSGGNSAIEQTCFQCHAALGESILADVTTVPNILDDFLLTYHMPITNTEQAAGTEMHDIQDADFFEDQANTGLNNLINRHVECTDCHNPHRVIKNRLFNADPSVPDASGTHAHNAADLVIAGTHTNIISGALAGSIGVEPLYVQSEFTSNPTSFDIKSGYAGINSLDDVDQTYVTREYQICLRCHSNYSYGEAPPDMPELNPAGPGTAYYDPATSILPEYYTNQAMEFQAPFAHQGEGTALGTGAHSNFSTDNHRSWHPVMDVTGRTDLIRGTSAATWVPPWDLGVGTQTMYCTDCHGSSTGNRATVEPDGGEDGKPWGPHGSSIPFLLKGKWDNTQGYDGVDPTKTLCFKCHGRTTYESTDPALTGFSGTAAGVDQNLHSYHNTKMGKTRCVWCHVAVPHGWKNKALMVNLKDVGPEVIVDPPLDCVGGTATPCEIPDSAISLTGYTNHPYYNNAMQKVTTFAVSSSWTDADCGGVAWMTTSCNNPP